MFFAFHSPASRSIVGSQYRSAIFVHTSEQREMAMEALRKKGPSFSRLIDVEDASSFYRAEERHQKFLDRL